MSPPVRIRRQAVIPSALDVQGNQIQPAGSIVQQILSLLEQMLRQFGGEVLVVFAEGGAHGSTDGVVEASFAVQRVRVEQHLVQLDARGGRRRVVGSLHEALG